MPIDRPEPAESLKATTAFCVGLKPRATLLSSRQLDCFRRRETLQTEPDIRAERGAYFVHAVSVETGQLHFRPLNSEETSLLSSWILV